MCLSPNEPGGPRRCDGHAVIGFKEAQDRLGQTIQEQAKISAKLQPVESQISRHRALAEHARAANNQQVMVRELAMIDRIEKEAEPLRDETRKLVGTKSTQMQALTTKRDEYYATSTGLQALQAEIDQNRQVAKDESKSLPEREVARVEASRLESIARKAKLRMDDEERNRLENAQKNGWDYQIREVVPLSRLNADGSGAPEGASAGLRELADDKGVTMYAQGSVNAEDPSSYDAYKVVIGNEEGKTVALDFTNYASAPARDPEKPLLAMEQAPTQIDVYSALNKRYASQRQEPSFDKWMQSQGIENTSDPAYQKSKDQWQASARERARLKTILGEERFNKLATL